MNEEPLGNFVSNIISFCPPIGRSVGRSIGSAVFQSVINLFAWSPGRSVAFWSVVCSVCLSFIRSNFVVSSFLRPFVSLFVYESVGLCI